MNWPAFLLCIFAGGLGCALAQDPEIAGISRELARDRAEQISEVHYDLSFTLTPGAPEVTGEVEIRFTLRRTFPLLLDFRQGHISSVQINGTATPAFLENDHLELSPSSLKRGENIVRIKFTSSVGSAGTAINRFVDHDDNSEYLYTLFVPMDASMAFPCFDQPDLKARFKLAVTAPDSWVVISNGSFAGSTEAGEQQIRSEFAETAPISTYLFAFAAGPFRKLGDTPGMPAIYARDSIMERAEPEVARVQEITSRGMGYFSEYFQQPFPFAKYDTVLIPGLAYAGMEHAGATFLREESVLFPAAPTHSDRLNRDVLVLHELAHQWFGDLVTMSWFDDLWLKEGFVQYLAFRALDAFEPADNVWKFFYESTKPAAYAIDSTQGTTPIYQDVPNLRDAKSAYGAIVYSKAPGALRQLAYVLGEDKFRDGLRAYLHEHAFGNANWNDLVRAFEKTSGASLKLWADAWIHRRGMPQVDVDWSCTGDQLSHLTLSQRGVLNKLDVWPLATQVLLDYGDKEPARLRVLLNGRSSNVTEAAGKPCPRFVFANDGDLAYGRFLLDERSRSEVVKRLGTIRDPFQRAMLWGSLWESVRELQMDPRRYVELAAELLPTETDEPLARSILAHVTTALHRYVSDDTHRRLAPAFETLAAEQMTQSANLDMRIVWFRALRELTETEIGLGQLKHLLSGQLWVPGVELRPLDRWNLVTTVVAMGDPEAAILFNAERERDPGSDNLKYAFAAQAARPDADVKAKLFEDYLHVGANPEDWVERSLLPFNSWNQSDLTAMYLKKALDALPQIKTDRRIFFLGRWLDAFIGGQQSMAARDEVHRYVNSSSLDKDVRLKILQSVDELDRTVAIRHAFPN